MTCGAQQLKAKLQNEPNGWLDRPLSSSTWKHWYLCMHQTTQASGVYCNENTLANTNMYFVSIRSVQATQWMFHLSVEGIQWQKVHSQWDCVSLNIANSECAQTLKLLVASDGFRSFFFLFSWNAKFGTLHKCFITIHTCMVSKAWDWWTWGLSDELLLWLT